jgi:hypothetical protein
MKVYKFLGITKKLTSVIALLVVVAGCSILSKGARQTENDRRICQKNMRSVASCVIEYWYDHDEQFPNTMEEAVKRLGGEEMAKLLTQCPVKETTAKFIYVNWSRWFAKGVVPKDYPMIYESNKSQHGDGINIVLTDGSVFWDENALWIADFAKKHPEYELELPQ